MNEPKPMRITQDQVQHRVIDSGWGKDHVSEVTFQCTTSSQFEKYETDDDNLHLINEYLKQKHIATLDRMIYGDYRFYIQRILHKFMCDMGQYKVTYPNINHHAEYVIPQDHIMEIERKISNLIKELD